MVQHHGQIRGLGWPPGAPKGNDSYMETKMSLAERFSAKEHKTRKGLQMPPPRKESSEVITITNSFLLVPEEEEKEKRREREDSFIHQRSQ